ncbi:MAG: hypothetical protein WKF66_02225 [Pedobacter sp.]
MSHYNLTNIELSVSADLEVIKKYHPSSDAYNRFSNIDNDPVPGFHTSLNLYLVSDVESDQLLPTFRYYEITELYGLNKIHADNMLAMVQNAINIELGGWKDHISDNQLNIHQRILKDLQELHVLVSLLEEPENDAIQIVLKHRHNGKDIPGLRVELEGHSEKISLLKPLIKNRINYLQQFPSTKEFSSDKVRF